MTSYSPTYGPPADPTNVTGRRIGAWFIDLLVYIILVVAAIVLSGTFAAESIVVPDDTAGENYCREWNATHDGVCNYVDGQVDTVEIDSGYVGGAFLFNLIGYIVLQGVTGGSLGKLAVGLRVVDEQGNKAGIGRSAVRTLLWVVDGIVCGFPVLGGVLIVTTKGHRRVGDMAAKTFVVDRHQLGQPVAVPGLTTAWPGATGGFPPVGGYGQTPSWGQAPGAWQPPTGGQQPGSSPSGLPSGPPVPQAPTPSAEEPTWDAARNAYIQYDRSQSAWVQWDAASQQWRPIDQ